MLEYRKDSPQKMSSNGDSAVTGNSERICGRQGDRVRYEER
jgi:hypothetical protein